MMILFSNLIPFTYFEARAYLYIGALSVLFVLHLYNILTYYRRRSVLFGQSSKATKHTGSSYIYPTQPPLYRLLVAQTLHTFLY